MLTAGEIAARCPGMPLYEHEPMRAHTSFRIGGPADLLAMPRSVHELASLLSLCSHTESPVLTMGNGTNLLVSDSGIRGLVIKTHNGLSHLTRQGEAQIVAGSGVLLAQLASAALSWGLSGLAFAHGIPGTVGGAVAMNAGAYGGEMKDVVSETVFIDNAGQTQVLPQQEHVFSHRRSYFSAHPEHAAAQTVFSLTPGEPEDIRRDMDDFAARRQHSQPLELPSAGSVFKRPPGRYAGPLIESCGLKGYAVGGARVSEKHAGFIVSNGTATCEDVRRLIAHIQEVVFRQEGVMLEPELKVIG